MQGRSPVQRIAVLCALLVTAGSSGLVGCSLGMGCLPGDDTETCCLKEFPGQYERCMGAAPQGMAPRGTPKQRPNPKPEEGPGPGLPPIPTPEEKERWRERCRDHYVACKEFFAGEKQRRVWGESQCQSCMDLCLRTGEWPAEANEHPCPGG